MFVLLFDKCWVIFVENGCNVSYVIFWRGKGFKDFIFLLINMEVGEMACKYYKKWFKIEILFKQLKFVGF